MPPREPFLLFTRRFHALGVRYMVSGSVAAIYYGEPRLTNDVDIIVFLKKAGVRAMVNAFPAEEFYCPPVEVLEAELSRPERGHLNLIHHETGFKADIYLFGSDPLHLWGIAHARSVTYDDDEIVLAPAEYVIVRKLQFYREGRSQKHLRDVNRMVAAQEDRLDRVTLDAMIREHALDAEWRSALDWAG